MTRRSLFAVLAAFVLAAPLRAAEPDRELVKRLKPGVVNVEVAVSQGLAGNDSGEWLGTGFIVDAARGLIVTNRHVSGVSPAEYKITFNNGESTRDVRLRYYDAWQDFAFLQIDTAAIPFPLRQLELGDSFKVKEQDNVFLIGNNSGNEYTILYGDVINTSIDVGDRHTSCLQISWGSKGGSSGSPILDAEGKVVGLHFKGATDDSAGYAIRIEYVKDALSQLLAGRAGCMRGDVGCDLQLMKLSEAQKYLHLAKTEADRIRAAGESLKNAIVVKGVEPGSPAQAGLASGDVVVAVGGKAVGDNLYAFDAAVDARLPLGKVEVEVARNGRLLKVPLEVRDAEKGKVSRFVQFGGGIIHEMTPELRRLSNLDAAGVYLTQAQEGSSLAGVSRLPRQGMQRRILITALNGAPTPDLDAFVREAARVKEGEDINLTVRNMLLANNAPRTVGLTVSLKFHPLKVFRLGKDGEWREESRTAPR